MGKGTHIIIDPDASAYAEAHTTAEDATLYALNRWAHLHTAQPQMMAGAYQGRLLHLLCAAMQPRVVVELGSFVGYSTICLARGLAADGRLFAIEAEEEYEPCLRRHLHEAGVDDRVEVCIGRASEVLPTLDVEVDLAYVDADKTNSLSYYEALLPKMRRGGMIVVDNVLWGGKVLSAEADNDRDTRTMRELNDHIQSDPRVENLLLPVRDGLMLCRVLGADGDDAGLYGLASSQKEEAGVAAEKIK